MYSYLISIVIEDAQMCTANSLLTNSGALRSVQQDNGSFVQIKQLVADPHFNIIRGALWESGGEPRRIVE